MALSQSTLDNLLEAESHIRAAIKSAAVNEKPLVVKQLSEILMNMEQTKKFDEIMDMLGHGKVDKLEAFCPDKEEFLYLEEIAETRRKEEAERRKKRLEQEKMDWWKFWK